MRNINDMAKIHKDKSKKVHKEPFYFFIWIFKVELIILIIFLGIGIFLNSISDKTKFVMKYNVEKRFFINIENEKDSYEEIMQALSENKAIKDEEKEFIKKVLKEEIEENIDYIDISKTIKRLKNLQVSYHKQYVYNEKSKKYELQHPSIASMNIVGNYNALFQQLNIYEVIDNTIPYNYQEKIFDFASSNKKVYFHELNHVLVRNSLSTVMDTFARNLEEKRNVKFNLWQDIANSIQVIHKNIFLETINELFAREYFDAYWQENMQTKSYEEDMIYAYALAEIISEETIKKYKFNDNQSILISGLLEIDDNMDEVYKLMTSINAVNLFENQGENLREENYKRIHDGYAYFYEKKYNCKMSDDLEMLLYFYGTPIQTDEEKNKIRDFLGMDSYDEIIQIIPKGYVSKDYKESHKSMQVEYTQKGNIKFKEINNM